MSDPMHVCACCGGSAMRFHAAGWMCAKCWRVAVSNPNAVDVAALVREQRGVTFVVRKRAPQRGRPYRPRTSRTHRSPTAALLVHPLPPYTLTEDQWLILRRCADEPRTLTFLSREIVCRRTSPTRALVEHLERLSLLNRSLTNRYYLATTSHGAALIAQRDAGDGDSR